MKRSTGIIFFICISFIISSSQIIIPIIDNLNYTPVLVSELHPQEVIDEFKRKDLLEFPPYLERYKGTSILQAIESDVLNKRIFFPLVENGIGVYYLDNQSIHKCITPFSNYTITQLIYDVSSDNLFVGSTNGLFILNMNLGNITYFNESSSFDENYIQSMTIDITDRKLYINTRKGLKILFTDNFTFESSQNIPSQLQSGGTGEIELNTEMGLLYLTAANKLLCYNLSSNMVDEIFYSQNFDYDFIRALHYFEGNNTLYLGCHGVITLNCSTNEVITNYNESMGLLTNVVHEITYTPNYGGIILVEQDEKGLAIINTTNNEVHIIRREDGLLTNLIGSLDVYPEYSSNDYLLIGCRGALSLLDIKNIIIIDTIVFNFDLPAVFTRYLTIDSSSNLVFISANEYLSIYNITSKQFTNYDYLFGLPEASLTETIYDNENNCLFIGTTKGVYLFNLTSEEVEKSYTTNDELTDNNTRSLFYLKDNNELYIGTNNGLNIINLQTDEIRIYPELNFRINAMDYDNKSNKLYLGTLNHLKIFDIQTQTIQSLDLIEEDFLDKNVYTLERHITDDLLFVGTAYGLYIVDINKMTVEKHFTYENSKLTDNLIDDLYFDQESEKLFIANLGVVIFDYKHDFWINLNDAYLIEEELFLVYIEDLELSDNILYFVAPYLGFYIINMVDTDIDGIEDCFEDWIFGTNPMLYDTDQDGYSDGIELWEGTDPLDPNSFPKNRLERRIIFLIVLLATLFFILLLVTSLYLIRTKYQITNM